MFYQGPSKNNLFEHLVLRHPVIKNRDSHLGLYISFHLSCGCMEGGGEMVFMCPFSGHIVLCNSDFIWSFAKPECVAFKF